MLSGQNDDCLQAFYIGAFYEGRDVHDVTPFLLYALAIWGYQS